jgi:hypothetical protein
MNNRDFSFSFDEVIDVLCQFGSDMTYQTMIDHDDTVEEIVWLLF